jgi:hypothetical protein
MQEMHVAQVNFKEAKLLADTEMICRDLQFVLVALARLEKLLALKDTDPVVVQSLWTAALISYVRCFSTGKRVGLSAEEIFAGIHGKDEVDAIDVHRFFQDLRNSTSPTRSTHLSRRKSRSSLSPPESAERKVEGVATLWMHNVSLDIEGIKSLAECARIAGNAFSKRSNELRDEVLRKGNEFSPEKLYDAANLRLVAPGSEAASKPRP